MARGKAERFGTWLVEWAPLIAVFPAGGLLTWAEYELGLLDWVDETLSTFGALLYLGAAQAVLVGLALAWRWRAKTRLVLAAIVAGSLALTVVELRALSTVPRLDSVSVDLVALAFAIGTSTLAALAFGIAPALRAAGVDVADGLRAAAVGSASEAS